MKCHHAWHGMCTQMSPSFAQNASKTNTYVELKVGDSFLLNLPRMFE